MMRICDSPVLQSDAVFSFLSPCVSETVKNSGYSQNSDFIHNAEMCFIVFHPSSLCVMNDGCVHIVSYVRGDR